MERVSIIELVEQISTEADAYLFMEKMRWGDKPVCPHCGSIGEHRFLNPENGTSRRTRTGSLSQRRIWKCRDCKQQFSVITNTPFHGSKVSLRIWIFVLFEMCSNKNGIAAREIARKYKLTNKTAWFVAYRVRLAMDNLGPVTRMAGNVVAHETWIGGDPENMHAEKRKGRKQGDTDKIPVVTLIDTATGEARSKVIPNVTSKTLRRVIEENVALKNSTLHTDGAHAYEAIGADAARHFAVDHSAGQYVIRGSNGTNMAENYFSQLKRSLDGTHHSVSPEHLDRYLAEFDFRYSTRQLSDTQRMERLMGRVHGRRLSYRPLTGE